MASIHPPKRPVSVAFRERIEDEGWNWRKREVFRYLPHEPHSGVPSMTSW